jgi:hypothetical protein
VLAQFEATLSTCTTVLGVLPAMAAPSTAAPLNVELVRSDVPANAHSVATAGDDFVNGLKRVYRRTLTVRADDDMQPRSVLKERMATDARLEDAPGSASAGPAARRKLFAVVPVALELVAQPSLRRRIPRAPSETRGGLWLQVLPQRLEFAAFLQTSELAGAVLPSEPLWCTLALFEFVGGRAHKMTEDHWFHVNRAETMRHLPEHLRALRARQSVVFNVAVPRPELHLVLRIYRVASAVELDDAAEIYQKGALSDKARGRWLTDVEDACTRFGHLRAPLACAAAPLFGENGDLIGGSQSSQLVIAPILKWRVGADIYGTLSLKALRKSKPFVGAQLVCQRATLTDYELQTQLDAKSTTLVHSLSRGPLGLAPHWEEFSLLFLHPVAVDLTTTSAKNIVCEFRYLESDAQALPLPPTAVTRDVFVAPLTGARTDRHRSAVQYQNRKPSLAGEEVKLVLPASIAPDAHVLVSFYHVSLSKKKEKSDAAETLVGFCVVPLLSLGAIVLPRDDELHAVPLASAAAPGYLKRIRELGGDAAGDESASAAASDDVRWLDNGRPLFQFRVVLRSSVLPRGGPLETLLALGYAVDYDRSMPLGSITPMPLMNSKDGDLSLEACELALDAVRDIDAPTALLWLPHIVYRLLAIVSWPGAPEAIKRAAFARLLDMCQLALWESRPKRAGATAVAVAIAAAQDEESDDADDADATAAAELAELAAAPAGALRRTSDEPALPQRRVSSDRGALAQGAAPALAADDEPSATAERTQRLEELAWRQFSTRTHVLNQFAWHVFDCEHVGSGVALAPVHETLTAAFASALKDDSVDSVVQLALAHANFLFDLIVKALVQHTPRQPRQRPASFNEQFLRLMARLGKKLAAADGDSEELGARAVTAAGIFTRRCLGLMDRGTVLSAVDAFLGELLPEALLRGSAAAARCTQWRFQFLRAVSATRHFVGLNMPVPLLIDQPVGDVTDRFVQRHVPVSMLLRLLTQALQARVGTLAAVGSLVQLLWRHDHDARYDTPARMALVAALYFPVLPLVLDEFLFIGQTERSERALWFAAFLWVLRNIDVSLQQQWLLRETLTRRKRLFELLNVAIDFFDHRTTLSTDARAQAPATSTASTPAPKAKPLRRKSVLATLRHTKANNSSTSTGNGGSSINSSSGSNNSSSSSSNNSNSNSGSVGKEALLAESAARAATLMPTATRSGRASASPPIQSVDALHEHYAAALARVERGSQQDASGSRRLSNFVAAQPSRAKRRGQGFFARDAEAVALDFVPFAVAEAVARAMSSEVCWTAVDVCASFMERFSRSLRTACDSGDAELFELLFAVLGGVLRRARRGVLPELHAHAWPLLSGAIERFRTTLFGRPNSVCGDLCEELLEQCCSTADESGGSAAAEAAEATRVAARDALAFVFEQNVATVGNAARTRLQTTIAAAHMLGRSDTARQPDALVRSLRELAESCGRRADGDERDVLVHETRELHATIVELVRNASTLAEARVRDPEMAADLLISASRKMFHAPDLRVAWLLNLSDFQLETKAFEEAAQAKLTCAVLVAEYMRLLGKFGDDVVSGDVRRLCPNIDEDLQQLPDERTLAALKDDICQSRVFSEDGFLTLVESAVALLKQGGLYESAVASYGMLLPLLTRRSQFAQLSEAHADLALLCDRVVDSVSLNENMRQFSRYYRVAFFGAAFGAALDGAEFVYKENGFCRLMDFTERMRKTFAHVPALELLENSIRAREHVPAGRAFLQIVAVEPHLDADELAQRATTFERNFNLRRFYFETPFTPAGRAQGELKDQWKRKSVLTLEAAFPHVRKRLRVVKLDTSDYSPIECAIELLQRKVRSLKAELSSAQPQSKVLQMELQGSLLTQVNVGPLAICETFLVPAARAQVEPRLADALFDTMRELEHTLGNAVKLNANLVTATQIALQSALEDGLRKFKSGVAKFASDTDGIIASLHDSSAAAVDLDSSELERQRAVVDQIAAARHRVALAAARAVAAASAQSGDPVAANRDLAAAREHLQQLEHGAPEKTHALRKREHKSNKSSSSSSSSTHAPPSAPASAPPSTTARTPPPPPPAAAPPVVDETASKIRAVKASLLTVLEQVSQSLTSTEKTIKQSGTPPAELLHLGEELRRMRPAVEEAAAALGVALPQPPASRTVSTPEAKLAWLHLLLQHSVDELRAVLVALLRAAADADDAAELMTLTPHVKSLHSMLVK